MKTLEQRRHQKAHQAMHAFLTDGKLETWRAAVTGFAHSAHRHGLLTALAFLHRSDSARSDSAAVALSVTRALSEHLREIGMFRPLKAGETLVDALRLAEEPEVYLMAQREAIALGAWFKRVGEVEKVESEARKRSATQTSPPAQGKS